MIVFNKMQSWLLDKRDLKFHSIPYHLSNAHKYLFAGFSRLPSLMT